MIANERQAELGASLGSGGAVLEVRRRLALFFVAGRVFAMHDFEPRSCAGGRGHRGKPERLAHERLDARATGAGEVLQHTVLGERQPDADSSHIRILNIAERMQLALHGQAQSGRKHGPGHTRLPCF